MVYLEKNMNLPNWPPITKSSHNVSEYLLKSRLLDCSSIIFKYLSKSPIILSPASISGLNKLFWKEPGSCLTTLAAY